MDEPAEFERYISVDDLGPEETELALEATAAEASRLAGRLRLVALPALSATVTVRRVAPRLIVVRGRLLARVVQTCVVSLDAVESSVADAFTVRYCLDPAPPTQAVDDDQDPPEYLPGSRLDVGELVAQQLSLAVDPYPRKPGADIAGALRQAGVEPATEAAEGAGGPFAALQRLRGPARRRP